MRKKEYAASVQNRLLILLQDRMRNIRKALGYTLEELCRELEISFSTLIHLENKNSRLSKKMGEKYFTFLMRFTLEKPEMLSVIYQELTTGVPPEELQMLFGGRFSWAGLLESFERQFPLNLPEQDDLEELLLYPGNYVVFVEVSSLPPEALKELKDAENILLRNPIRYGQFVQKQRLFVIEQEMKALAEHAQKNDVARRKKAMVDHLADKDLLRLWGTPESDTDPTELLSFAVQQLQKNRTFPGPLLAVLCSSEKLANELFEANKAYPLTDRIRVLRYCADKGIVEWTPEKEECSLSDRPCTIETREIEGHSYNVQREL